MCNKEPYPTKEAARKAAKGIGQEGRGTLRFYFCGHCEVWHLGSTGNRTRHKPRNRKQKYKFQYHPNSHNPKTK